MTYAGELERDGGDVSMVIDYIEKHRLGALVCARLPEATRATRWFLAAGMVVALSLAGALVATAQVQGHGAATLTSARAVDEPPFGPRKPDMAQAIAAGDASDDRRQEHEAHLDALRQATAAGDLDRAVESFQELRQTDGGATETNDEAANLLTHTFLDAARDSCRAGRWKEAAQRIDNAIAVIGERDDLRRALTRYDLAIAIMNAAKAPAVAPADQEDLRRRLDEVKATDPDGLKDLETAMLASRLLPEGSLDGVMKKLRPLAVNGTHREPVR